MDVSDVSDRTGLNDFHDAAIVVFRVDLGTKLSRNALFLRFFRDESSFKNRVRERFFDVHVLASSNGSDGSRGVVMIGGAITTASILSPSA